MTRLYVSNTYSQRLYQFNFGDLDESICSTEIFNVSTLSVGNISVKENYNTWSNRYGFCDEPNGAPKIPSSIKALQAFTILSLIFAVFATIVGLQGLKKNTRFIGGTFALLGTIFSIATFSQGAATTMYSDLRLGTGYMPVNFAVANTSSTVFVGLPVPQGMSFTFSYFAAVLEAIFLMYATFSFFRIRELPSEDDDITFEEGSNKGHSSIHPEAMYTSNV